MDLRGIANQVSDTVNPNIIVSVKLSTGYTTGAAYKQIPSYAAPVSGPAQIQALDSADLRQIEGMNLEGVLRAIYFRGALAGVVRANSQGGDLVVIAPGRLVTPALYGTWLIAKVLESWPLWTKAVIVQQVNS